MLVIGLTGGIGSGKSTVAQLFAKHGAAIIDADAIARDLTQPHCPAYAAIVAHFGKNIAAEDGTLDRKKLRNTIFQNPSQRDWLEKLLHPLILQTIEQKITTLTTPYCICIVPLLFETGPFPFIQRTLVIDAPEVSQIDRVMARDHLTRAEVAAIIQTQITREVRLAKADDVISNEGNENALASQVEKLHQLYLRRGHGET
jgi:dephospho-CoA kinase